MLWLYHIFFVNHFIQVSYANYTTTNIKDGVEEYLIISFCFCYRIKDKKIYPLKFAIELDRKYECLLFQFHLAISLNSIGSNFGCCLKCNLQIGDIINFSYLHHAAVGEVRSLRLNIVSIQYDGHEILLACVLLICRLKIFFRVSIFFDRYSDVEYNKIRNR